MVYLSFNWSILLYYGIWMKCKTCAFRMSKTCIWRLTTLTVYLSFAGWGRNPTQTMRLRYLLIYLKYSHPYGSKTAAISCKLPHFLRISVLLFTFFFLISSLIRSFVFVLSPTSRNFFFVCSRPSGQRQRNFTLIRIKTIKVGIFKTRYY